MTVKTVTTAAGKLKYTVQVKQFENLDEFSSLCAERSEPFEETLLSILNAAQEQGAKQGAKEAIRKAVRDAEGNVDAPKVVEAIVAHQTRSAAYLIGAPRGPIGGVKKADRTDLGTMVVKYRAEHGMAPSQEEMEVMLAELGI